MRKSTSRPSVGESRVGDMEVGEQALNHLKYKMTFFNPPHPYIETTTVFSNVKFSILVETTPFPTQGFKDFSDYTHVVFNTYVTILFLPLARFVNMFLDYCNSGNFHGC